MQTPSMPGGDRVKDGASQTASRAKDKAGAGARRSAGTAGTAAGKAGAGVQQGAGKVAGTAVALPGQVARLGRLLTLRRLLRYAPAAAAAGAAVLVARRFARKR
jgi:hypothetical protein